MNKQRYVVLTSTVVAASLLLSGCQLLTGYQQIDEASNATAWAGQIKPIAGEVNIACSGTYHCEITQVDQTLVVAPDSHKPLNATTLAQMASTDGVNNAKLNKRSDGQVKKAPSSIDMIPLQQQNSVKVVPLSASGMKGLTNYYVRLKPAKHEIHVNFYPENNLGYIERFAIIHEFVQPGTYQLHAYRQKSKQASGSLLESASPNPLCIDLLYGNAVQRRFCKQLDSESQGEFVETVKFNRAVTNTKIKG
jgi:outer membrane murein-binding lipoprotein Lpp